jgi:hypothetical protein
VTEFECYRTISGIALFAAICYLGYWIQDYWFNGD